MFRVIILSEDYYFANGLSELIKSSVLSHPDIKILKSDRGENVDRGTIIFRESLVSIHLGDKEKGLSLLKDTKKPSSMTIHIPFLGRNSSLTELSIRLKKILMIAEMDLTYFMSCDMPKAVGIKKHLQLSLTEEKIMLLIGKGYDSANISKILSRSEKTINTHFRHAARKLGFINRADFYKYASFLAHSESRGIKTLCL